MSFETESRTRFQKTLRCVLACSSLALGCAGAPRPRATPDARAAPGRAVYSVEATAGAVAGEGELAGITSALAHASREAGLGLVGDGRLALLARRYAADDSEAPPTLVAAARALGLVDVELAVYRAHAPSADRLPPMLEAVLAAALRERAPTHFGVFVADDGRAACIVLGRRPPQLARVPSVVPCCAGLHLSGRLSARERNPELVVTGPGGVAVYPAGTGPDFELNVATPAAGDYHFELRARGADRTRAVAELALRVGGARDQPARREQSSVRALRDELYRRCVALRAEHGLAPLAIDGQLEARAVVRSRASQPRAAHGVGDVEVSAARGLARGADADQLFAALLGDAAFRGQLLSAEMLHFGIGVSRHDQGYIAAVTLAHEPAARLDPELAAARVLGALNENRRARGGGALRPDPALTKVAARAVRELAENPTHTEPKLVDRTSLEYARLGLGYARIAAVAVLVSDPLDAAALEPALDADASAAGVALCDVQRASASAQLAVVIALGWER